MSTVKNKPWLTASKVERPLSDLKIISRSWDLQTWNDYLNWYESSRKDKLVTTDHYNSLGESVEKNIFEEFGYKTCSKLQSFCDQLLATLPNHHERILREIYLEGRTIAEVAHDLSRSRATIHEHKINALTALKRGHRGKIPNTRRIMRGEKVFNPANIKSIWNQKLSHPIKDQRVYDPSNANDELLNHQCAQLREIFQDLSELSRQIIYLKFWCGFSISEIARKSSIGVNTVEQIIDSAVFYIKSSLVENFISSQARK